MRRRDALKAVGSVLGVGVFGSAVTAHPGPYEPYGYVELEGAREAVVSSDDDVAYVATTTGYASVDVSVPDRPRVLADVREPLSNHESGPLRQIYDVDLDADSDTLAVVGPANSRPGAVSGVLLSDVSDPAAPERVSFHETTYSIHNCFLRDGVVYLTGNDGAENPLVLLDAASGETLGRWSLSDADPAWSDVPASLRPLHDVFVRGDVAHLSLWDAGTWLVDVSDPAAPTAVGSVEEPDPTALSSLSPSERRGRPTAPPGNHHYSATDESGDLLAVGKESWARRVEDAATSENATEEGTAGEAYVGGPSGIDLWDVSDPAAPERLSTIAPPPSPDPTYGGVWTTAHNFQIRDGRLYSSWYQGGVKRHDVSDPREPKQISWWRNPDEARFWSAQLAAPGAREGFFVASSMGVDDVSARLYTFPDHAGRQANPPTVLSGEETTESIVVTATGETRDRSETATRTPGFGAAVAAGSLSVAGWLVRRRAEATSGADGGKDTRRS
ncbi:LVIVD repeat-containing protein [Halopelagius inordinatus]|uniref:LVIVD repeat-containing protein n=1 Tax=Halopelagius inordinatus TaxID=553467 RepID=A0A1I2M4R8_9EURY|nr:hypothetical protein [Halopelagius inordinatus]SFF84376.1 LVIVD repeat-containing protein [Halopelagius inordinatus]